MKIKQGIGLKTLVATGLVSIAVIMIQSQGLLNVENLRSLDPLVPFAVGLFTILLGRIVFRFADLDRPSLYSLSYLRNDDKQPLAHGIPLINLKNHTLILTSFSKSHHWEASDFLRQMSYITIFICLSLFTINNHSLQLVFTNNKKMATQKSCAPKNEDQTKKLAKTGCKLMIRAHKLGYVKDLGSCQPAPDEASMKICPWRQADEPYLHYAFRQISKVVTDIVTTLSPTELHSFSQDFLAKAERFSKIKDHQLAAIQTKPQSFHHIWTNLPHPQGSWGQNFQDIFSPNHCLDRYSRLPHLLKWDKNSSTGSSEVLDHVMGHLLFNPRYKSTVAYCREVKIHWNSPPSACTDLKLAPESFLQDYGVFSSTIEVLQRHRIQQELWKWTHSSVRKKNNIEHSNDSKKTNKAPKYKLDAPWKLALKYKKPPKLNQIVSFQCLMHKNIIADKTKKTKSRYYTFKINNHKFRAREVVMTKTQAGSSHLVETYKNLSQLLAPGFKYSGFVSRAKIKPSVQALTSQATLTNSTYILSRLEELRDTDIFLGHAWIHQQPDLLEIYPYYYHLYNYVDLFRKEYQTKRGRM